MNGKRAKAIRAALREGGADPGEKKWMQPRNGGDIQARLTFECGRAKYKRFKRYVISLSHHPAG